MELEGMIRREKHSWATNVDDQEEMKSLIPNDHDGTSGVGYDSINRDILFCQSVEEDDNLLLAFIYVLFMLSLVIKLF